MEQLLFLIFCLVIMTVFITFAEKYLGYEKDHKNMPYAACRSSCYGVKQLF